MSVFKAISVDNISAQNLTVDTINGISIDCFIIENKCKQYCDECKTNLGLKIDSKSVTLVPKMANLLDGDGDGDENNSIMEKYNEYLLNYDATSSHNVSVYDDGSSYNINNDDDYSHNTPLFFQKPKLFSEPYEKSLKDDESTILSKDNYQQININDNYFNQPDEQNTNSTEIIVSNNNNIVTLDTGSGLFNNVGLNIDTNTLSHLKIGMNDTNDELILEMRDNNANSIDLKIDSETHNVAFVMGDCVGDEFSVRCHPDIGTSLIISDNSLNKLIYLANNNNSEFSLTSFNMDKFQVNLCNDNDTNSPNLVITRGTTMDENLNGGNTTKITSETIELFSNTNGETNNNPSIFLDNGLGVFEEPVILIQNVNTNDNSILTSNTLSINSDIHGSISLNNNSNINISVSDNINHLAIYPQYIQLPVLDEFPDGVLPGAICCKQTLNESGSDDLLLDEDETPNNLWWFNGKKWFMFA